MELMDVLPDAFIKKHTRETSAVVIFGYHCDKFCSWLKPGKHWQRMSRAL